jgi:hypothetical protein
MKIICFCMILFLSITAMSQCSKNQSRLGVRLGIIQGISYQHYISENVVVEGVAAMYRWDPALFVFGQFYTPYILSDPQLRFVLAAGVHAGYFKGYKNTDWFPDLVDQQEKYFIPGVDFQIGVDYDFTEFPVNLTLEYRPAYNMIYHVGYWYGIALTVRYVFKK